MDLTREHFRAMIFYDFKRGLSYHESHENLVATFGDTAPSLTTVFTWFKEFQRGRQSLQDDPRSGRPPETVTDENARLVKRIVDEKRNSTVRELQQASKIPSTSIHRILRKQLGARKVASRWIPHLLTPEQKEQRVEWCHFMLDKFNHGRSKRVYDIVTGDETWICCYEPESKQQSTVWMFDNEPPPTKVVRAKSTKKQMVAVFFTISGHVMTVPLEEGRTVTAEWYTTVCLPEVFKQLQEKRRLHGVLLHHDNAPAHTAARTIDFIHGTGVQLLSHPPYSPDLAPCDFFLFPKVKKQLRGKRFESVEAAIAALNEILSDIPKTCFLKCFNEWFCRMDKCIRAGGEYFEKL